MGTFDVRVVVVHEILFAITEAIGSSAPKMRLNASEHNLYRPHAINELG